MDYRLEQLRYQLREDPSSRLFFQLGDLLRKDGQLEEAVEILRDGLDRHPRYVSAWVSLGRSLHALGDPSGAGAAFDRSLELDPENAVAARMVGEVAIASEDWLKAVKSLKLARGLSPGDSSLDELINMVETRLDERGELQVQSSDGGIIEATSGPELEVVSLSAEEPFAVRSAGETGAWDDPADVFEAGKVEDVEPQSVAADEVFEESALVEEYESGVEGEDSVEIFEEELEAVVEPHDELATGAIKVPPELLRPTEEASSEEPPEPSLQETGDQLSTPETDPEVQEMSEPELAPGERNIQGEESLIPEAEAPDLKDDIEDSPAVEEFLLPTITLAQLAIDQGDFDLARRTLRTIVQNDPGNVDATSLLDSLDIETTMSDDPLPASHEDTDRRVHALQRWLGSVKLASERLGL